DQGQKFVYVVNDQDEATPRPVKVGRLHNGMRVVQDGLNPGERVVVTGLQRVRPGAKVTPKEEGSGGRGQGSGATEESDEGEHQGFPGPDYLAESDPLREGGLSPDSSLSLGGAVWLDGANSSSGSFGIIEHRRRTRAAGARVCPFPVRGTRLPGRGGKPDAAG